MLDTAVCVGGPFAGQALPIPFRSIKIYWSLWPKPQSELLWIAHGPDRHAYTLVENQHYGDWRLVYRDTF